jgi:aspartyl-tRNA(Asn)/glutamyl-tRNA(Gln) amidotransferase subunit A
MSIDETIALGTTLVADAARLRAGETTSVELVTESLAKIHATNDQLGAFVTVCDETALAAAAAADADFAAGIDRGPLQGLPLAIKDIISTQEAPTTANSRILPPGWGDGVDAPVVARLRAAGGVVVGKSTTSEFAIGLPDPDTGFLVPRNPWNLDHSPAGSSSGTGIAVAAGIVAGGLGTDTGGSVRSPASMNGHTGLKVTFGRVPKSGVVPLGYSLDSVGPMARSAMDCAALLSVMAGYDASDPDAADVPVPDFVAALHGSVEGMRIGMPLPYFYDDPALDPEVRDAVGAALDVLAGLGSSVAETTALDDAKLAKEANTITLVGEAMAYHAIDLQQRWDLYGCHTRIVLARGAMYSAADFAQAQRFRRAFRRKVAAVLSEFDVLITPTSAAPAPRRDEMTPEKMLVGPSFTGPWNFTGLPAVAVPCGFSTSGLPLSMQIVGRPFAEATVLKVADAFQRRTDWHLRMPPIATAGAA